MVFPVMQEHVKKIERSLSDSTFSEFNGRVEKQADFLKECIRNGELENQDFTVGLELEVYASDSRGRIKRIPEEKLNEGPANPELGLHNAEINTEPELFTAEGVEKQRERIEHEFEEMNEALMEHGFRLVFDSMWTNNKDSHDYLTSHEEVKGFVFPENMKSATRYHAIDNAVLERLGGSIRLDLPGVDREFPTFLFECLATSIQPHLQVPDTEKFPEYFNAASRTAAPLLMLSSNSPFLPIDLYPEDLDAEELVDETFHELRIPVFEQACNEGEEYGDKKVRFAEDIENLEEAVDKIAEDPVYAPALREWEQDEKESWEDEFWELRYKRGTFWRWVRPVFGAEPVEKGNNEKAARIEYRPLPTQPGVEDIVSLQVITAGLLHGLEEEDHPINELEWSTARENFYSAVEDGLDAEITWVNEDGRETCDEEEIFEEVFRYARLGLEARGFPEEKIEEFLDPLKRRWNQRRTPSTWKKQKVRENLDKGESFEEAVKRMQKTYITNSRKFECFADWPKEGN
jgi:gamma-glutamyl:cysteine ligase YbdK (ATP-grasp superfamily)